MKEFKTRDIITPVIDFIKTCPFLEEYKIDVEDIGVQMIVADNSVGSALDYVGSVQLSSSKDLLSQGYSARQANFNLYLLRRSGERFLREEVAQFLWNFEQWVEHCQYHRITPKISEDKNDKIVEHMSANNGVFFSTFEGQESSIYAIQLQIIYYNKYQGGI